MGRRLKKLALGTAAVLGGSFGLWSLADACAPGPAVTEIKQTFNDKATSAAPTTERDYVIDGLKPPENTEGLWRIRLGAWEMAAGGYHTFLEFSPYDPKPGAIAPAGQIYQIHGIAMDQARHTYAVLDFSQKKAFSQYFNRDYVLKAFGVNHDHNRNFFRKEPEIYVDVFYGSKDEVLKKYMDAMQLVKDINVQGNNTYYLIDHNSNSVQRTLIEGLGLPLTNMYQGHRVMAYAGRTWTPGIELSLLPKGWNMAEKREQSGYKTLTADDLEKACKAASGEKYDWSLPKPPAPKPSAPQP